MPDVRLGCSIFCKSIEQRSKMALVFSPAADRPVIERLPDLPKAVRLHRSRVAIEFETGRLPFEAEKRDQSAALLLKVRDKSFILQVEHAQRQHAMPMRHQPLGFPIAPCAIRKIISEEVTVVKSLKET